MKDNINVLYIEDNKGDIQLLKTYILLNKVPINLKAYIDIQEAFNFLNNLSDSIDVILLDYCLYGNENCLDILNIIKENEKIKDIPVIIFSNWNITDEENAYNLKNKADYYLVKPTNFDDYLEVIQTITSLQKKKKIDYSLN